ncbi:hypothetical protein N7466_007175 [Penicillium verhagenii]|uniref:uncharacterized protein n=1 Tax=Penicillium verhagenii TaxID=1562060 RepID=UPI002544E714|nr:uncharacterized protein N7466_007175 [Penicillium verhagenii]KAJ5928219.1 hypothetical protein N7466_007175 [Penicillium verhagenii]
MSMRASSATLRLSSWLGRSDRPQRPGSRRLLPALLLSLGGLVLFYLFIVPQLLRFRFRLGLSRYDLGFSGFGPTQTYLSFDEEAPIVEISPAGAKCDQRYTFLAPRGDSVRHPGPMILDAQGELVYKKYNWGTTQDFKVQHYKGEDYLTYWQGDEEDGHGRGSWYMLDYTYTPKYIVSPVGILQGDLHDLQITVNDTALLTIYEPIPADLTSVGGPELGWLYEGVIQEVDIATGELLFEWRSSHTYPPETSYEPLGDKGHERTLGYDYFHMNSVDKNDDGHYLVSARHTHTVTCIDSSGKVLWTLGGKYNDFDDPEDSDGSATGFKWQHDARWRGPNRITILNNAANDNTDLSAVSQGLLIELDIPGRTAKVVTKYSHPQGMMAVTQGNVQVLDTGNVLVGWGHSAAFTEFSADGEVVCNTHFGASAYFTFGRTMSYRVFKDKWVGMPDTIPDAEMAGDSIFVSWNGATEVASWALEAWDGDNLTNMTFVPVDEVPRSGFETEVPISDVVTSYFRVAAINSNGEVIGRTEVVSRGSAPETSFSSDHPWGVTIILVFSFTCLLGGLYCAVFRRLRRRRPDMGALYQLVRPKDEESDTEHSHLPI